MTVRIHGNNFVTVLAASLTNVATTINLTSITGIPSVGSSVVANGTITDGTNYEIVQLISYGGIGNIYNIARAQEGTTARAWSSGDMFTINITRDSVDDKLDHPTTLIANGVLIAPANSTSKPTYSNPNTTDFVFQSNGASSAPTFKLLNLGSSAGITGQLPRTRGGYLINAAGASSTLNAVVNTNIVITYTVGICTITLPTTFATGDVIVISGFGNAGGWVLNAGASTRIHGALGSTSSGGSITATGQYDSISIIGLVGNSRWGITSACAAGVWTFA